MVLFMTQREDKGMKYARAGSSFLGLMEIQLRGKNLTKVLNFKPLSNEGRRMSTENFFLMFHGNVMR